MKKNKKKIITIIFAIMVIAISFMAIVGFKYYEDKKVQQHIDSYKNDIVKVSEEFSKEEDRDKKKEILTSLINSYNDYKNKNDSQEEVIKQYSKSIADLKTWFKNDYEKTVKDNTIDGVENVFDKNKISAANENLSNLIITIEKEKNLILTKDESKTLIESINKIKKTYEDRMKAIEEQEKKAEEEKKAAEEAAAQASANGNNGGSGANSGNYNSGNGGSDGGSSSSEGWIYHGWGLDENGNKEAGTDVYHDSNGNVYDENGNSFNMGDYFDTFPEG